MRPRHLFHSALILTCVCTLAIACEKSGDASDPGASGDEPNETAPPETVSRQETAPPEETAPSEAPAPPEETGAGEDTDPQAIDPGLHPEKPVLGVAMRPLATCASVVYVGPHEGEHAAGLPRFFQRDLCGGAPQAMLDIAAPPDADLDEIELVDWQLLDHGGVLYVLHDGVSFYPYTWPAEGGGVVAWPPVEPGTAEVDGGEATEHLVTIDGNRLQVHADAAPLSPDDDVVQRYGAVVPTRTVAAPGAIAEPRASAVTHPEPCERDAKLDAVDDAEVETWCEPALTFVREQSSGQMHVTELVTVFDEAGEKLHGWEDMRLGIGWMLPGVSSDGRYLVFDDAARGWVYDLESKKLVFEMPQTEGRRYGWYEDEGDDGVPDKSPLAAGPKFVFLPQGE